MLPLVSDRHDGFLFIQDIVKFIILELVDNR